MSAMIEILLATFNGERFLKEQLESLQQQTYTNWKIIARDDGSSDNTLNILNEFKKNNPTKIDIYLNKNGEHGPLRNFNKLMKLSTAKYVAFCDQDDVWIPTKLEDSLKLMEKLEQNLGNLPILIHTDLFITDKYLNIQYKSMIRVQKLNYSTTKSIKQLITQNCATGCTMMANRTLVQLCGYVPSTAVMHDWWLAILACAFGKLAFLDESTVFYRQHESNTIGVTPLDLAESKKATKVEMFVANMRGFFKIFKFYKLYKLISPFFWYHFSCNVYRMLKRSDEIRYNLKATYIQSEAFLQQYRKFLTVDQKRMLTRYCLLFRGNKFQRVKHLIGSGYFKTGLRRKIGQIFYI